MDGPFVLLSLSLALSPPLSLPKLKNHTAAMPLAPRRRPRPRWPLAEPPPGLFPTGGHDLLRLLAVLSIAAAAAAVCSLLNRPPDPFCHSDSDSDAYDSCQPCPPNARCVDGKLECIQGFKKYGKICVEDGLVTQTANKISELLQVTICHQHARALCGQPAKILFQQLDISNMADDLLSSQPLRLSQDGIQVAKNRVLESARGFFETTLTHNKVEAFKCPELVAERHRPLTCQLRQWIFRNIILVMTFCTLVRLYNHHLRHAAMLKAPQMMIKLQFAALLWILWIIYQRRAFSKRAEQIYEQVCEILEDNAINAKIGNSECEPWVVTSWLRDHLLIPRERRNASLWKKVEELVLEDSRIDQYPKVIKGESKVVFEWQAGGSLSRKIKKMQGESGKTRSRIGAIKLAEVLDGCVGEAKDCSTRKQGSKVVM